LLEPLGQGEGVGAMAGPSCPEASDRRPPPEVAVAHEVEELVPCRLVRSEGAARSMHPIRRDENDRFGRDVASELVSRQLFQVARLREGSRRRNTSREVAEVALPLGKRLDRRIVELDHDLHIDPRAWCELVTAQADFDSRRAHDSKSWRGRGHSERGEGLAPNAGAPVEKRHLRAIDLDDDVAVKAEAAKRGKCVFDHAHAHAPSMRLNRRTPVRRRHRQLLEGRLEPTRPKCDRPRASRENDPCGRSRVQPKTFDVDGHAHPSPLIMCVPVVVETPPRASNAGGARFWLSP